MATTAYELLLDGAPAGEDLYGALSTIEVEENVDLPGAIRLHLPVDRTDAGDLTFVGDARLGPFAALAVVTRVEGGGAAAPECVFDGLVLAHKLHLDAGTANATLEVYGQDATWRMNLEEKTREWVDVTDAAVAETIFGDYGITSHPDNAVDDSPSHTEANHSLMQRGTDIQFLRNLARRNGKLCRVVCADRPGRRIGVFARPSLDGAPVAVLALNDPEGGTVDALDFSWDVARPSAVRTWQLLFNGAGAATGASGDADDPGLATLDARGLPDFAGRTMTVLLTAPVGDAGELALRAQSLLREAGWFARCDGEADAGRLGAILRAGTVVRVDGAGNLHSGKYYVWSVRHTITGDAHGMRFTLLRNAIGPPPAGALAP